MSGRRYRSTGVYRDLGFVYTNLRLSGSVARILQWYYYQLMTWLKKMRRLTRRRDGFAWKQCAVENTPAVDPILAPRHYAFQYLNTDPII